MATAISRRTGLAAELNDTVWYDGDPDLIDVAGLAANLACRLVPWPDEEKQFEVIDPRHYERLQAGCRFAPMIHQLTTRALAEGWTRKRLLAATTKLDSDYRGRHAVRAH